MAEGIDFSWARPGAAAIKRAGKAFVLRYLNDVSGGKGISVTEFNEYQKAGIAVAFIWEGSGSEARGGPAAGTRAAKSAAALLKAQKFPANSVVYYAIDYNAHGAAEMAQLTGFFKGINSVRGITTTGVYGGLVAIQFAQANKLADWFWQTYAWSAGRVAARINLYQYLNGQTINGGAVDLVRSLTDNFGQIGDGRAPSHPIQPGGGATLGRNITSTPTATIQKLANAFGYHLVIDGIYGPNTTAVIQAIQDTHKLVVDGIVGVKTLAVLQHGPGAKGKLVVDGIWGRLTTEAEQRSLKVKVDGIRGYNTIRAEQQRTGAHVDGIDGPDTRKHLQKHVGVKQDGIIGPITVKALQKKLNAKTF